MTYPSRRYQIGELIQPNDTASEATRKRADWHIEDFYDGSRREAMIGCDGTGPIYSIVTSDGEYATWVHESQIDPGR